MEKQTMTVAETAEFLGVSQWTIYDMTRRKEIPFFRVRSRIFFRIDSLTQWMREQEKSLAN